MEVIYNLFTIMSWTIYIYVWTILIIVSSYVFVIIRKSWLNADFYINLTLWDDTLALWDKTDLGPRYLTL